MLTAVVTKGLAIEVQFVAAEEGEGEGITFEESQDFCEFPFETEAEFEASEYPCDDPLTPLEIEAKELAWGAGAFIVLALLMRFWLFPAVKKGMEARYSLIRDGHEQADTARGAARAEVAEYESALATVKAEANERLDAARQTLESERSARLAEVNTIIAAKREAAAAEAAAAREAASADVASAVADVASRTVELATGKVPDAAAVNAAVDNAMGVGVSS